MSSGGDFGRAGGEGGGASGDRIGEGSNKRRRFSTSAAALYTGRLPSPPCHLLRPPTPLISSRFTGAQPHHLRPSTSPSPLPAAPHRILPCAADASTDEAMESPTSPASRVDFYDFLDRMHRPAAAGLFRSIKRLAEGLDMQPPVMPDDGNTTRVTTGTDVTPSSGKEPSALEPIWDDDDTKAFYECLPNLRVFVPAVLLGEAEQKLNEQHAKGREQSNESGTEQDIEVHDNAQPSSPTDQLEGKADDGAKDSEDKDRDKGKDAEKDKSKEKELDRKIEREKEKVRALDGANLDNLLQRLPRCARMYYMY